MGSVLAVVLTAIGLADAPEAFAKWSAFLYELWMFPGIDWAAFFSGAGGRWILSLLGIAIGLWTWEVPERLKSKWQGKPFSHRPIEVTITRSPERREHPTVDIGFGHSPNTPHLPQAPTETYPTVQLFKHQRARQATFDSVKKLYTGAGYKIIPALTDLPQHAEGIWLHGGTSTDRAHAKWALVALGVEPQIDYADDKPEHFQVIVGHLPEPEWEAALRRRMETGTAAAAFVHALSAEEEARARSLERTARDLRNPPASIAQAIRRDTEDTASDLESAAKRIRVKPEPDLSRLKAIYTGRQDGASKAAAAQGLRLRVFIVPNTGGTPGGSLKVQNEATKPVDGVTFVITDLRVWDERHKEFVTHPDIYANSSTFPGPCTRNHRQTLHCGVPGDYGLLRVEGNRLSVEGTHEYKTTKDGRWEMKYKVGPDDESFIEGRICFEWKASNDIGKPPTLKECDCPHPFSYEAPNG